MTRTKSGLLKITIGSTGRYNFHNASDMTLLVSPANFVKRGKIVESVEITPSQSRRISRHFCGMSDCLCGSGPAGYERYDEHTELIHLSSEEFFEV